MAEELKRDEKTFQEVPLRADPKAPFKDPGFRVISAKPKAPVNPPSGRDWSAGVDLVAEAADAVRLADERANSAERYSQELVTYYSEQVKTAEMKIAALEKRLEVSEAKAQEAEEWLARFHDAIMTGFGSLIKKAS